MSHKKYTPITKDTHDRLCFRGFSLLKEKNLIRHDCNLVNYLPHGELGEKNQFERDQLSEKFKALFPEDDRSAQARMTDAGKKCPPLSNTGGVNNVVEFYDQVILGSDGKLRVVPLRRGVSTSAFIDQLTFIVHEDTVRLHSDFRGETDFEVVNFMSHILLDIFGFGVFSKNNGGKNFYTDWYRLGNEKINYGFVAIGGKKQKGTICVQLTATGCNAALVGWENRLYEFLTTHGRGSRISRIDLTHDFLEGEYNVDKAFEEWKQGQFTSSFTRPKCQTIGSDWHQFDGSGRTLAIGSRTSSRYLRIYEKGREQGDINSEWVRVELEMKPRDMTIPLDILLNPGEYLCGSYPALNELFKNRDTPKRPVVKERIKNYAFEHCLKYAKWQSSRVFNYLMDILGLTAQEAVEFVVDTEVGFPSRLDPSAFDCRELAFFKAFNKSKQPDETLINLNFQGALA